jgi:hypothetical protein
MRSLRCARNSSLHEHERLVYEGWILYDSGHREEALAKAQQSIGLQRSFEAFFLRAYALGDSSLDTDSSLSVVQLLEHANSCASDNLRKGQVRNDRSRLVLINCFCSQLTGCRDYICLGIQQHGEHLRGLQHAG